jgi:hypothetical protein
MGSNRIRCIPKWIRRGTMPYNRTGWCPLGGAGPVHLRSVDRGRRPFPGLPFAAAERFHDPRGFVGRMCLAARGCVCGLPLALSFFESFFLSQQRSRGGDRKGKKKGFWAETLNLFVCLHLLNDEEARRDKRECATRCEQRRTRVMKLETGCGVEWRGKWSCVLSEVLQSFPYGFCKW